MRTKNADDDDGGNASTFENKWQYTPKHTHNHINMYVYFNFNMQQTSNKYHQRRRIYIE